MKKALPILFITLLLDMIGFGMIIPILPIIFTDPASPSFLLSGYSSQAQYIIAGVITALAGVMTFIASPIMGELSDIYGRKKLLSIGVLILALSQLFFGIGIGIESLTLLFIARAIAGLAGGNISIVQAGIADITLPKDRAKNFGLIGAAFGLGFIIGPVLSGYVASATGNPSMPFFVAGVLGLCNFLFVIFLLPETNSNITTEVHSITVFKALHNIKNAFVDKEASHIYASSFLYLTGFAFFTSITGIFLVHKFSLTEAGIGTYFGVIGFWVVLTQIVILRIVTKKYSERQILRVSILAVACSIAIMPYMPTLVACYILLPFIAIPQGLSLANMTALISKSVSPSKQGAALGINGSLQALAQGAVPLVATFAAALFGLYMPYLLAGIFIAFSWKVLFAKSTAKNFD